MAKTARKKPAARSKAPAKAESPRRGRLLRRWLGRALAGFAALLVALVVLFNFVNPPTTIYMLQERSRLGSIEHDWVDIDDIAPVMLRSAVAAEDANFCLHWGFDMAAIRQVIARGESRGASTITQQVAKNVFLWQGRNWLRKGLEAVLTPVIELFWSKRRILEVYLNVAEFGDGIFGIGAASKVAFGVTPAKLSAEQAARLAVVLPDPKGRSASHPSRFVRERAAAARDGAATIEADGRATCFAKDG